MVEVVKASSLGPAMYEKYRVVKGKEVRPGIYEWYLYPKSEPAPVKAQTAAFQQADLAMQTGIFEGGVIDLKDIAKAGILDFFEPFMPWGPFEYEYKWKALPPGGEPFAVPEVPGAQIVKRWHTGTAEFAILSDGRWAVLTKEGTWKIFRHKKPYVIPSQNLSYKGASKLKAAARKYIKLAKKVAPVLGYKVVRRGYGSKRRKK